MSLRIALAQLNLFVGDVGGNTQRVIDSFITLINTKPEMNRLCTQFGFDFVAVGEPP